jgi:hypothetical protein
MTTLDQSNVLISRNRKLEINMDGNGAIRQSEWLTAKTTPGFFMFSPKVEPSSLRDKCSIGSG